MGDDAITKSNDPKLTAARVFIGNLPSERTSKEDLQEKFKSYGQILGIAIHKGFAFIQYEDEAGAIRAVEAEHNTIFKGNNLDLRISNKGSRKPGGAGAKGPMKRPYDDDPPFRDDWRGEELYGGRGDDHYRGPPPPPFPRDDPFWRDRYGPPQGPPPPGMPPMMPQTHSNGAPHDPFRDDREPYPQPLHVVGELPGGPPKLVDRPFDAVIVVTQKSLKLYAEMLERRLLDMNMTVDMIFLIHDHALNKAIDDMSRRGVLYIIVVQPQHEEHKSITVNIMHGAPQEHRNMPLEDALQMMGKNFNAYLSSLRNGSEQPTMGFLLNLLADGKQLSVDELDRIIAHLEDRRDRLIEAEGGARKDSRTDTAAQASSFGANNAASLQQKILSLLSNNMLNASSTNNAAPQQPVAPPTPALALANLAQQFGINISQASMGGMNTMSETSAKMSQAAAAFSDPNMRKTLDGLLQNTALLKSLLPQASVAQKFSPPSQMFGQASTGGPFGPPVGSNSGQANLPPPPLIPQMPPGRPPMLNPNLFSNFDPQQLAGQRPPPHQFHGFGGGN